MLAEALLLVRDLMSRDVVALPPDATVGDALARMDEHQIHELPVMDNSSLKGWISYDALSKHPGINRSARVTTVMVSPPRVNKGDDALTAAELLIRTNLRAVPVVDAKGMIVGILSRTDLLAAAAQTPALAELRLENVMTRELETVTETTDVDQAAHGLRRHNVNQLLVLDAQGRLLGHVTKEDVLGATSREHNEPRSGRDRGVQPGRADRHVEVKGFLRPSPSLSPASTLAQAVDLMRRQKSTFVAVVDEGFAVGIVSRANIVERLANLRPGRTALCQITGLHDVADRADFDAIHSLAQETLKKITQELREIEFLNLHYKVYKAKSEEDGDRKFSLSAHLSAGGRFFVQKADDWDLQQVTREALDQLAGRIREQKELRLEKRKGAPRRTADFYTASRP